MERTSLPPWWPLVASGLALLLLETLGLDRPIAQALYYDAHAGWLGAGRGDWWADKLLHDAGRWLVRGLAAAATFAWALSFAWDAARPWRRRAGYIALGMVLATVVVGLLKAITNVDCPWNLAGFGGHNSYVPLFADRPDALPRAQCFPGAHASSGFALMAFYFALRDHRPQVAGWLLAAAISIGVAFSIGQEARGAHFLSHDLASAVLVWLIQLALYCWLLRHESARPAEAARDLLPSAPAACSDAGHPTTAT